MQEYEDKRGEISFMEKEVDNIFKEHEYMKEQLSIQKAERVRVDIGLKRIGLEVFIMTYLIRLKGLMMLF